MRLSSCWRQQLLGATGWQPASVGRAGALDAEAAGALLLSVGAEQCHGVHAQGTLPPGAAAPSFICVDVIDWFVRGVRVQDVNHESPV